MNEIDISNTENKTRGVLLTIVSIFLALGSILSLAIVPSQIAAQLGIVYQIFLVIAALITGVSAVGIWLNRKWGALTYICLTVINQPLLLFMGWWNLGALIIPGVIVVLLVIKLKSMK